MTATKSGAWAPAWSREAVEFGYGAAWQGTSGQVSAVMVWRGEAKLGWVRPGGQGTARRGGASAGQVSAVMDGLAWPVKARSGKARRSRYGRAWLGQAWRSG